MLSIFPPPQNSPLKPLKTEHFLFELFPLFSLFFPLSFNKPDLMFLFIVGLAGDLFSLLFF